MYLIQCASSSNEKVKSLFTPWKLLSIEYSEYWFCVCVVNLDWYLFHVIVYFNPDFDCCSDLLLLSSVGKIKTVTCRFVFVIVKVVSLCPPEMTQFADQVLRLIS